MCRNLCQDRSVQRYQAVRRSDEDRLTGLIIALACDYGRYGYRRITALIRRTGWMVNHKRVERLWKREGLKVPRRQPKRKRLWLNNGSCVRLRPEYPDHVWSYDFVHDKTSNGRPLKMLTILDEYSRECLGIVVDRKLKADDVQDKLAELFVTRGIPDHLRSDNGKEFTGKTREWLSRIGVKTEFITPGSPWENGYNESFNGKFTDELLDGEIFDTLQEAQVIVEQWRQHYNTVRPHSSLGYRPPAPETVSYPITNGNRSLLTPAPLRYAEVSKSVT